ncbi:MAG: hypothetical protein ACI8QS_001739 [Planctomycetota bacterium]
MEVMKPMERSSEKGSASRSPFQHIRKALGHVRRSVTFDVYDFFICRYSEHSEGLAAAQPPAGYAIRFASTEEVTGADVLHTELDERERIEGVTRLGFGHRCVAIFHGDLMVFSMWENPRNANVPGLVKRKLSDGQSFLYKAYTSPEHRGQRLYQAGLAFALRSIAAEGKAETVGYAHIKKKASRAGLARLGYHEVGRVRQLTAPGLHRTWADSAFDVSFPDKVPRTGAVAKHPVGERGTRL